MYALVAIIFLGVIYQGARPTIMEIEAKSRAKRQLIYSDKLSGAKASGFKTQSNLGFNPVPYRSPIKQWLLFTPITLGIYPVVALYKWGSEMKRHADIGPGGAKNLLFFLTNHKYQLIFCCRLHQ